MSAAGDHPDEDQLGALADGSLGARESADVREHVDGCDPCRELVAALMRARRELAGGAVATTPARIGPFEILGLIGRGGMGEVYRARDSRLRREVAIKVLPADLRDDPGWLARFEGEARAVGQLSHPNILQVFEVGEHDGSPYLVTELLDGSNLRAVLRAPIAVRRAVEIAADIATGLAAAHDKGIVHRDLKPENVFVTRDGRIKILDFGLAKQGVETSADEAHATQPGTLLGTVGYMAPEQVLGKAADERSDIFSLGVVLYEMLTGRPPFTGAPAEVMSAVLRDDPPALPAGLPAGLAVLVRRCLEKDPALRLQSARDLALFLRDQASQSLATAITADLGPPRIGPKRAPRLLLAAGLITALAGGVGLAVWRRPASAALPRFERITYNAAPTISARFLADGNSYVYGTWSPGGTLGDIYLGRFDTFTASRVVERGLLLDVSSRGEIAFLRDTTFFHTGVRNSGELARVAVTGGGVRPVAGQVSWAAFDPAGDDLAMVRATEGMNVLEYRGQRLFTSVNAIGPTRFSPRGDLIAFARLEGRDTDVGDVAVVDLGGKLRVLTAATTHLGGLAWAPAGDAIYYLDSTENSVHRVALDGGDRVVLTGLDTLYVEDAASDGRLMLLRSASHVQVFAHAPGTAGELDVSRFDDEAVSDLSADGRSLLLSSDHHKGPGGGQVYLQPAVGGDPAALGHGHMAVFSPDGRWAVVALTGNCDIGFIPTGDGVGRALHFDALSGCAGYSFTSDGKQLVFIGSPPGKGDQLWQVAVDGGTPRALTGEGVRLWPGAHAVAPDDRKVVAFAANGELSLFPLDGGAPRAVPGLRGGEWVVGWTADSRSLYVVSVPMTTHVDLLDVETGERRPFQPLADRLAHAAAYRVHITPAGDAWTLSFLRLSEDAFVVRF